MPEIRIRPVHPDDRTRVRALLTERWGAPEIVSRGALHHADELPGFIAILGRVAETDADTRTGSTSGVSGDEPAGLITFRIEGASCEIVTLDSLHSGLGVGSRLIGAVREHATKAGCARLWLITTNDNTHALRFYQRRGFVLAALHRNAIEISRRIKPGIPLRGADGIPIRDEIELEMEIGRSLI